ncbi:MAG: tetratricopeptide repeat protein [Alphaproteobacteria bacterium]|nr:tetratricopeptide repeat protein [Alphaproteobacteria bacterium]
MADATRKLATIVALDVAGYSARTEADEAGTTAEVAALHKEVAAIAQRHGGRVFNTAGDGFMLEFPSSLLAVEAAFELAETCNPKVRVGVHLGDVMVQPNGDLLGHGVNVAARLMAQAAPGTVLVSADVRRMMRGPLAHSLRSRGTIKLPKMSETIEVFTFLPEAPPRRTIKARLNYLSALFHARVPPRVALAGGALIVAALAVGATLFLLRAVPSESDVPFASVAVMPFESLSSQKEAKYFAVGIQDEILTRLAKIGSLKVISRTSTAQLASRPDNLQDIARQLGVANILEGSVQREGDTVRVNVQLIRASSGDHLWADTFDRKLDDIFSVQSDIAVSIAAALNATVTEEEKKEIALQSTTVPGAYDAYLRGLSALHDRTGMDKATAAFHDAIALDDNFALAWAYVARLESQIYAWREATPEQHDRAQVALEKASRQPDLPEVQLAQGFYALYVEKDYGKAREQFEKVHATWPNDIESFLALGSIARRQERWVESRSYYEQAVALDPLRVDLRSNLLSVLVATRDLKAALAAADDALVRWPTNVGLVAAKVRILQNLGRLDEADALLKPLRSRPERYVTRRIVSQALYSRKYDDAIGTLQTLVAQETDALDAARLKVDLGYLLALKGDAAAATQDLTSARDALAAEYQRQPKNAGVLHSLAWAYCYLGDRAKAEDYVQRAMEVSPIAHSRYEDSQMRIWAYFGDADRAIGALERLQQMPSGYYTPAILRLDPIFDKVRGDPRFKALAAEDAKVN